MRGVEHKPGVRLNNESAIRHHAKTTDHVIHQDYVEIVERNVNNRQERLFLEVVRSIHDHNSVNEHIYFPQVCLLMAASLGTGGKLEP